MRSLFAAAAAIGVAMIGFAATHGSEDVGYVEIRVAPGFVVPPLALGAAHIDTKKTQSTVLRERVGPATLTYERYGERVPFCEFAVRKDRIVTIAVAAFGRDPRCKVQG
jgi:hypothetical protein